MEASEAATAVAALAAAERGAMTDVRSVLPTFDNAVTLEGFSRAIVALAWIYNRETKASHLVLGLVDLIPDEVPRVDQRGDAHRRLGKESAWTVYFDSRQVPAAAARAWYENLVLRGEWAPDWREAPLSNAIPLENRLSEPRWPGVVTRRESRAVPPAFTREEGTRLHHLLTDGPLIPGLLSVAELSKLMGALEENLDVDLRAIPELLQSAHFFQPVPVLRHVSTRLDAPDDGPDNGVLLDAVPRKGASLNGLTLQVFEHRPTGWRLLSQTRLQAPFCRVPLSEDVEQVALRVFHDDFGLLVEQGPYAFLRRIDIQMQLLARERRVSLPARKGREAVVKRIPVGSDDRPIIVGKDTNRSAARVLSTIGHRLTQESEGRDGQRWFRGDVEAAERAIQQILSSAKRSALVVDAYFAAPDVKLWLPVIANRAVEIRILTSTDGLRRRAIPEVALKGKALECEHLKRLQQEIESAEREQLVNSTAVRIMRGKHPAIHDRFIAADDRVWLLGASLSDFGTRGTMLVALPAPGDVLPELEKVWRDETLSTSLVDRLSELAREEEE